MDRNYFSTGDSDEEEDFGAMRGNINKSLRDLDELEVERKLAEEREELERQQIEEAGQLSEERDYWGEIGIREGKEDVLSGIRAQAEAEEALQQELEEENQDGSELGDSFLENMDEIGELNATFANYRGDRQTSFTYTSYVTPVVSGDHPEMERWPSEEWWETRRKGRTSSETRNRRQEFLSTPYHPDGDERVWRGKKVLGKGGGGIVGLWEHVDLDTGHTSRLAVKSGVSFNLRRERDFLFDLLNRGGHCVQLIGPQPEIVAEDEEPSEESSEDDNEQEPAEGLEAILMEFCEGGTLHSRMIAARKSNTPFEERVIWSIFDCLIKGLNTMDHGAETKPSDAGGPASQNGRPWRPITHFDLKPPNILLTALDGEHDVFPRCKIADFGLGRRPGSIEKQMRKPFRRINYRRDGTWGYHAPEQFSLRWQDKHWMMNKELTFGTHTNIWMVGVLMYQLCTLRGPPSPAGFRCENITGLTYGPHLKDAAYSKTLKNLIWKCLAEKPSNRATLDYCSIQIEQALSAVNDMPSPPPIEREEPVDPNASPSHVTGIQDNSGVIESGALRPPTSTPSVEVLGSRPVGHRNEGEAERPLIVSNSSIEIVGSGPVGRRNEGEVEKPHISSNSSIEVLGSGPVGRRNEAEVERPPTSTSSVEILGSGPVGHRNEGEVGEPPIHDENVDAGGEHAGEGGDGEANVRGPSHKRKRSNNEESENDPQPEPKRRRSDDKQPERGQDRPVSDHQHRGGDEGARYLLSSDLKPIGDAGFKKS